MNLLEKFNSKNNVIAIQGIISLVSHHTKKDTNQQYVLIKIIQSNNDEICGYMFTDNLEQKIISQKKATFYGSFKQHKKQDFFHILRIKQHNNSQYCIANKLSDLLNQKYSGNKDTYLALCFIVETITQPFLAEFVFNVLSSEQISSQLINLPASIAHHHSQQGGLLKHSIEVSLIVLQMTHFLPEDEVQLAVVAALFHDIAKIKTYTHSQKTQNKFCRSLIGNFSEHDDLNLYVLAPHLQTLESQWESGAAALMQILKPKTGKYEQKRLLASLAVQFADAFSAMNDAKNIAFENTPAWFYFSQFSVGNSKNYFNRIKKPSFIADKHNIKNDILNIDYSKGEKNV